MATKKKRNGKRGGGRPPFKRTPENALKVRNLRACGATIDQLCLVVGCSPNILRKYFKPELEKATIEADMEVVGSIFTMACGAPAKYDEAGRLLRAEQPRTPSAAIWWTKARLGWKETDKHEFSGPDGNAIPLRFESLSDAQLVALLKRIEVAINGRPAEG